RAARLGLGRDSARAGTAAGGAGAATDRARRPHGRAARFAHHARAAPAAAGGAGRRCGRRPFRRERGTARPVRAGAGRWLLMLARVLGSRGFMSTAMLLTVALVAAAAYGLARPEPETRAYRADMPDSVGLYEGSAVTVLGVRVGEVTGIESIGASARVRFTVRADRTLPTDVGAVTVSDTLLADRRLELVGA